MRYLQYTGKMTLVSTIWKNISQWEGLSHILWKIKHVWNHQPVYKQIKTMFNHVEATIFHRFQLSFWSCCGACPGWPACCPASPAGLLASTPAPWRARDFNKCQPQNIDIAIENGTFIVDWCWLIYPLKMVIFRSYVSLPEGSYQETISLIENMEMSAVNGAWYWIFPCPDLVEPLGMLDRN